MARITRKTLNIFAGSAAAGALGIGQFGSAEAGSPAYSTDPAVIQALAAWAAGWANATLGASKFPPLEDMNAVQYVHSYEIAYLLQEGIPEYDSGTTYYVDSIVKVPNTTKLYVSLTNANQGNALPVPPASNANWSYLGDLASLATAGGALQAANNLSDLANLTTALTNLGFAGSPTAHYIKLPGGLIIQWGTFTGTDSTPVVLTFPIAFPTAALFLMTSCTPNGTAMNTTTASQGYTGLTASGANIFGGTQNNNTWLAIGY